MLLYKKNKNADSPIKRFILIAHFLCFPFFGYTQVAPKVTSEVDTTLIKIGEQIIWMVTVDADSTAQVIFPEGQTFSPLETVETFKTDTTRKEDRITLQKKYALTQFDSGSYKLPIQRIEINGRGFFTDSTRINVSTVPVDTTKQKLFDIKPLIKVEKGSAIPWNIIFYIAAIALLFSVVLGVLIYWFVLRKKPLTQEEKKALLPPYDRALLELKQLENSKYLIQDQYKKYYSELTGIVRSYLEEDVNVLALESTTNQLIETLEMMKSSGKLELDKETISQFKRILQTADLVKFAKSKPETSVAEQDRKTIEGIVVKTHEALPEPTEEELMQEEEYQKALKHKKKLKKWYLAGGITAIILACAITVILVSFGPRYTWDTITRKPTKILLEGDWISSSYGFPPIILETPEVLVRQKLKPTSEMKSIISGLQAFSFVNSDNTFTASVQSVSYTKPQEPDFKKALEAFLKKLEKSGVKNITTKQEEFTSISGVKGIKVYGSGKFPIGKSKNMQKGKYNVIFFGGQGFQQQVAITWLKEDSYAEEIANRILATVDVKTEL